MSTNKYPEKKKEVNDIPTKFWFTSRAKARYEGNDLNSSATIRCLETTASSEAFHQSGCVESTWQDTIIAFGIQIIM